MANRLCPLCFVKVPRGPVLARSSDLLCPSCHCELELSRYSRVLAALLGVIAAFLAVRFTLIAYPASAWVLSVVAAVLAYGIVSALFLFFLSDLVIRPQPADVPFPQPHG